jgi:hypothetical protein
LGPRTLRPRRPWSKRVSLRLIVGAAVLACMLGVAGRATANIIASSGFDPTRNGFSFANYGGGGYANLSATEMQELFGVGVCSAGTGGNTCQLTPVAQTYMDNANQTMARGHCFGFSALSLLLFRHEFPALAGKPVDRLKLSTAVEHAIAYAFQLQLLPAMQDATVHGTPTNVLDFLINTLGKPHGELYTMSMFRPGLNGGHAVTPYAVDDLGNNKYDVLVYDNNWPDQVRRVHFDTAANTWNYFAATNPKQKGSLYKGNAHTGTLSLVPTSPGLGVQYCPFCGARSSVAVRGSGRSASLAGSPGYDELQLQGNPYNHGHLLIHDPQGQAIGFINPSRLVDQIPGATAVSPIGGVATWRQGQGPLYRLPVSTNVMDVSVDSTGMKFADTEHFTLIGQAQDVEIDGINLRPGDRDTIELNDSEGSITYRGAPGAQTLSPYFTVGLVTQSISNSIGIQALTMHPDSAIKITDDRQDSTVSVNDASAKAQTFLFRMTAQTNGTTKQTQAFQIQVPPGRTVYVVYSPNVLPSHRVQTR